MSFYDDASLVVIPSAQKTSKLYAVKPTDGSGDLAFTRTGDTATRVNSAGLIEKVRTNLNLYSQDLTNAAYISGGTGSVVRTGNYAAAPDGTNTATRIQITRGATYQELYQRITGLTVGDEYTLSFYAKSLSGTPTLSTAFNNGYANEVTFTSSWVRYTYTFIVAPTGRAGLNLLTLGGGTSTTADILVWGVQIETGDIATAYIPTTTAAVSVGPTANTARLDYLGSTCPRLLLEPQRTNLVTYSEQFNNAAWNKEGGNSVTANTIVSPDGYNNADTITATSGNAININQAHTSASNSAHTFSIFLKKNNHSEIDLYIFSAGFVARATVNFDNGTITNINGSGATITNYGNGWYRCSIQATINSGTGFTIGLLTSSTTGSRSVYAYGAQLEVGYATSYIPTLAASATRGADACSKTGISSLIGVNGGSIFVEFDANGIDGGANYIFDLSDGSNFDSNRISMYWTDSLTLSVFYGYGGTYTSASYTSNFATTKKIGVRWTSTQLQVIINGVAQTAVTYGNSSPTKLNIGSRFNDVERLATNVKQCLLFNTTLTTAQLIELTTL